MGWAFLIYRGALEETTSPQIVALPRKKELVRRYLYTLTFYLDQSDVLGHHLESIYL